MSPNTYSSGAARAALLTLAAVTGLLASAFAPPAAAVSPEDLLRPEQAFRYQVEDTGEALLVRWTVEPGYYLYRQKLGIGTDSDDVLLGDPALPTGEIHEDEYFGRQEIYRGDFTMQVPYVNEGAGTVTLELRSQGCADIGLCYPPQRWTTAVTLAGAAPPASPSGSPFGSGRSSGGLAATGGGEFLPPDVAFRPVVSALDPYTVELAWQIEPGYYLYRDKLSAAAVSDGVQLGGLQTPAGKKKFDEYFGETEVYYDEVVARVPLNRASREGQSLVLELGFQGCAEDGICYPPLKREVSVSLPPATAADAPRPPDDAMAMAAAP